MPFTKGHKINVGRVSWVKGKHLTDAHKKRISEGTTGKKRTEETKNRMRLGHLGLKASEETRRKISVAHTGKKHSEEHTRKCREAITGEKNYNWIADRSLLKRFDDVSRSRRCYAYGEWRKRVWVRDGFKCRIANQDCKGKIEAHHILSFTKYPELRYNINNGITLCHAHHPKKRAEEKLLIPDFQRLVGISLGN